MGNTVRSGPYRTQSRWVAVMFRTGRGQGERVLAEKDQSESQGGNGTGGLRAGFLTHRPTISFTVLVTTPFRARARLAAGRERPG